MEIFFDIETVPTQSQEQVQAITDEMANELEMAKLNVKAPANYKDQAKIVEYIDNAREILEREHASKVAGAIERTALDGGLGQIICIGWAIGEGAAQSLYSSNLSLTEERELLNDWFAMLRTSYSGSHGTRPVMVGHNSNAFDIPFIWKRCIVHGIKPPHWFPRDPKPWGEGTFDTMTQWAGARDRISMDRLCRVLGIPGKGGISGRDVWPLAQRGEFVAIAEYCRGDIDRTRAIYHRMTFAEAA